MLDVVVFPDIYRIAWSFIHTFAPLLVTGVVERDASRGKPLLRSERVKREAGEYSSPSPAARAVKGLQAVGKTVRSGQRVHFLFTLGRPGTHAWDAPDQLTPRGVDLFRYQTLFTRAVQTVLGAIQRSVLGGIESDCLYLLPIKMPRIGFWTPPTSRQESI